MSEVGTPPPYNLEKSHRLVASLNKSNNMPTRSGRGAIRELLTYLGTTLFFVCFVCLYCVRRFGNASVKLQCSISDAAVRDSIFRSMIRFVQNLCNHTFTVLKSLF